MEMFVPASSAEAPFADHALTLHTATTRALPTVAGVPPRPLQSRRSFGNRIAIGFLEAKPPVCYDVNRQICNRHELRAQSEDSAVQDQRMRRLKHDWAASASLFGGRGLQAEVHAANAEAAAEETRVEARAKDFKKAWDAFEKTFAAYQKEEQSWREALRGLEDDYSLHCRPFHDVTMQCEKSWRQAMRWWFAREPLPGCLVGVVTPYARTAGTGSAHHFFHWPSFS